MASASGYNHHRFARAVLKKSRRWESSLTVQLFSSHWRFENSPMNFQYEGDMKPFLLALRSQVIPATLIRFLYSIQPPISFVDGCLVVEIQDYRKSPETRSRVVMRPAAETLAQTIDVMLERKGQNLDEGMGLELESRIIAATSPPLYLGTSILATRNATLALALTSPAGPSLASDGSVRNTLANGQGGSGDSKSLDKMSKLLRAGISSRSGTNNGNSTNVVGNGFQPNWNVLRAKEQYEQIKLQRENEQREAANRNQNLLNNNSNNQDQNDPSSSSSILQQQNGINNINGINGENNNNNNNNISGEKKKGKKKRPPPIVEEEEIEIKEKSKIKKKKKTNNNNNNNQPEPEPTKIEDQPPPQKKKKKSTAIANNAEIPPAETIPVKKKTQKKKKDDGENKEKKETTGQSENPV
ncbi:uncharacterized protein I206_103768 [Kwoniella pini CBS 10737]|uniref:Spt20-like SEP domain-containing protein n=1 Tax=Kwoniella pini CBS 10737 TaxID=1296096 RepID=A0A1B9HSI6_9TREE|nr:uncharacterized protein I206_07717 [Kwoniella pini CBS 10737]OCF46240.1 hypothetical protein I206_07717 [Kwoniella pini CBS 10737]